MVAVFLILSFVVLGCQGFTFVSPPVPGEFPHYTTFTQMGFVANAFPSIFNKTHDIGIVPQACPVNLNAAAGITGKIAVIQYDESSGPCTMQEVITAYNTLSPVAYFIFNAVGADAFAYGGVGPYYPVPNDVPIFTIGAPSNVRTSDIPPLIPGAVFSPNASVFLNYPSQNPEQQAKYLPGPLQVWIAQVVWSVVVLVVASWKLSQFVHTQGVQINIAQSVLVLVMLSSVFMFTFGGMSSNIGRNYNRFSQVDVVEFFQFFFLGFSFTGVLILGFYFGEIASLTSAQEVAGLSKMKIPAGILIAVMWIVIIAIGAVNTSDPETIVDTTTNNDLQIFEFAFIGVVVPFFCTAVLVWGSIALLVAMSGSGNRGAVVRIVLVAASIVIFYWTLAFVGMVWAFIPPPINPFELFGAFSFEQVSGIRAMFFLVGFGLMNLSMVLAFSVTVAKEIEVSKSGTSSTSGSSSSGSSSSSSSSNDPVIEL